MCGRYNRFIPASETVETKNETPPLTVAEIATALVFGDVELVDPSEVSPDAFLPVVEFDPDATWIEDGSLISVGPVS